MSSDMIRRPLVGPISRGAARAIVVLFALSFLLSGAAYWFSVRAVQGEIRNRATVVQLCETGNEFRASQVRLWTYIIAISAPPPHETPAHRQQREATVRRFEAYIRKVFQVRDCGHLSGG